MRSEFNAILNLTVKKYRQTRETQDEVSFADVYL